METVPVISETQPFVLMATTLKIASAVNVGVVNEMALPVPATVGAFVALTAPFGTATYV